MSNINIVEYDANKHAVEAVTVFQTNRAEVLRRIKVNLKDGQNEIEVTNLPSNLHEDSIRVDGIGNAVILDVIYHSSPPPDQKQHDEVLGELTTRRAQLQAELDILDSQRNVLKDYCATLSGADTSSSQLESFLDLYAMRNQKINRAYEELQEKISAVDSEIEEASVGLNKDEESVRMRGVRLTIVVLGEGDGEADLSLTYIVEDASWTPQYDLRATIAQDEKSESTVVLHYRASIRQSTGENWNNVALQLSTASPLQGTTIPTLNPYWIGERVMHHAWKSIRMASAPLEDGIFRGGAGAPPPPLVAAQSMSAPAPRRAMVVREAVASSGAISATFSIPGRSTIPTNSSNTPHDQTHKVSIAEISFKTVDLEWITVPKDTPSAFLQCKVKNTSQYILLPGQTNVFMNNSFVAKSQVPHVSPQESFSCSLGVDPAIRVTYHPESKKTKTSGSLLTAKATTTAFEQRITIKNTRLSPVRRLIVRDQVPVSRDARIKVNIIEPKDLSQGKGGPKQTNVKDGVVARWMPRNDGDDDNLNSTEEDSVDDSASGLLEWVCEVKSGATLDVNASWEVSVPTGVQWVKQM